MRNIKVVSTMTSGRPVNHESSASTWGELAVELQQKDLLPDSYRAVEKDTKRQLSADDAILPEGDFSVWISPKKVKSAVQGRVVRGVTNQFRTPEDAAEEAQKYMNEITRVLSEVRPYIGSVATADTEDEKEQARKWFAEQERKGNL